MTNRAVYRIFDWRLPMNLEVRLYTILKKYGHDKIALNNRVVVSEHITLNELCSHLDLPQQIGKIFLVNGFPVKNEYHLNEGDKVKIFAFIGGG